MVRFPSSTGGYRGPGSEQPSPTGRDEDSLVAGAECILNSARIPLFSLLSASLRFEVSLNPFNDALGLPFSKEVSPLSLARVYMLIS